MKSQDFKKLLFPDAPGVYLFKHGSDIIYVGKATSLKSRVQSYFGKDLIVTRGPFLVDMVTKSDSVEFVVTDTVLEALILEANLIKQYNPKYNTKEKDNKSYNYVCITKDEFPRVVIIRGRQLARSGSVLNGKKYKSIFGPYPSGEMLRTALKIIRKIFPYLDAKTLKKDRYEFYKQLHLAPDIGANKAQAAYAQTIRHIEQFLRGEKGKIVQALEKEMKRAAKHLEFEHAGYIQKQLFALTHINDVSLLKDDRYTDIVYNPNVPHVSRIEAYDIAHTSGSSMVGVFSVIEEREANTAEYRLFNIRGFSSPNDPGALGEVISRRLNHSEWPFPDVIVADGNQVQKAVIEKELAARGLHIPVIAVVKDDRHKARAMIGNETLIKIYKKDILLANAEAHRYALARHIIKRGKLFLKK